jgi:hypothetical protein
MAMVFIFPRREYATHRLQAWAEMRGASRRILLFDLFPQYFNMDAMATDV